MYLLTKRTVVLIQGGDTNDLVILSHLLHTAEHVSGRPAGTDIDRTTVPLYTGIVRSLLPRPDLFIVGIRQRIFQTLIQVVRHGEHGRTETDYRTAYTSPEVTYLPGSFQAPAMHVLFITTQLYIWEDFLKPGRTDDVARVIRQLVIQRIGTAVAHDRLFREVAKHPRNEQG